MTLIKNKIFYTYEDITLLPSKISSVKHREECIPLDENGKLPLFTAPMDTVVNHDNFSKFENEGINAILPRTEPLDLRVEYSVSGKWAAYSLKEFEDVFCKEKFETNTLNRLQIAPICCKIYNCCKKYIFYRSIQSERIASFRNRLKMRR